VVVDEQNPDACGAQICWRTAVLSQNQ
jgi:hypothetical protein